ncbi:MAG: peptide-methionine (R)-S-oxide reductase, partial [Actinobacteria bacterium]|nr:peptide-methionine (R)-S-oxide reductase [Actinomycetota bacterium]
MDEITGINSKGQPYKVKIDEAELKSKVDPLSFDVLRKAATETAFTGEYTDSETIG